MDLRLQGTVTIRVQQDWRTFDVYIQGRNGALSPISYYFRYKGRWITSLERAVRNWDISMFDWLKIVYCGVNYKDLLYNENPFLK